MKKILIVVFLIMFSLPAYADGSRTDGTDLLSGFDSWHRIMNNEPLDISETSNMRWFQGYVNGVTEFVRGRITGWNTAKK